MSTTINFAENEDLREMGLEIMDAEYPHLVELGVEIRFRISKKEANIEADNFWGETRLFTNEKAYEAQLSEVKTAKINPPTFVCISCMKWWAEKQKAPKTIGADKRNFCISCGEALSEDQRNGVDEGFIATMIKRQKRVDAKETAGPPEYAAFFGIYMVSSEWAACDDKTKRARLSCQLARCGASKNDADELKLRLLVPTIKVFPSVIETHGTGWWKPLDRLGDVIKSQTQLSLEMVDGGKPAKAARKVANG